MKLKLKSKRKGSGGIKAMLLNHGEKIGMGCVGLCVAWFVYAAMGREPLDSRSQPEQLRRHVKTAREHLEKLSFDEFMKQHKIAATTSPDMQVVKLEPYKMKGQLNSEIFVRKGKRPDPELLSVEDIEVSSGVGLVAYNDSDGNRKGRRPLFGRPNNLEKKRLGKNKKDDDKVDGQAMRAERQRDVPQWLAKGVSVSTDAKVVGKSWAVVLAKVPLAKQRAEYVQALRNAEDYNHEADQPDYFGYRVQRAEIRGSDPLQWESLTMVNHSKSKIMTHAKIERVKETWSQEVQIVDPRYFHDLLTFPLPPLVDRGWDSSITHSEVPLASPGEVQPESDEGEDLESNEWDDFDDELDSRLPRGSNRGHGRGPAVRGHGRMRKRFRRGPRERRHGREAGMGQSPHEEEVPHLLFRFFDFEVQPGKRYKYRVQLILYDANSDVPQKFLAPGVIERRAKLENNKRRPEREKRWLLRYRLTGWSQASPAVTIPFSGQLLAGAATHVRPDQHDAEPSVVVVAKMLDTVNGVTGFAAFDRVRRGSVGNWRGKANVVSYVGHGGIENVDDFKFLTNMTLLDVRGEDRLSSRNRELTAPSEVLLLDPAGQLVVQTEMGDKDMFAKFKGILDEEEDWKKKRDREEREEELNFENPDKQPRRRRGR